MCKDIFLLLTDLCKNNKENQMYIFQFIMVFKDLIGYGNFITDFFQAALKDNDPLVHGLYNLSKIDMQKPWKIIETVSLDDVDYKNVNDLSLIKHIT